jgi:exopolysaccharide production protein ExoQ
VTERSRSGEVSPAVFEFFAGARLAGALSTSIVATAFLSHLLERTIGWAGLIAILVGQSIIAAISLAARRGTLDWRGLLPISLLAFVTWSATSILWSQYQWATLGGIAYQLVIAYLAIYVALTRDFIQIVRIFGDVLRVVLSMSLIVEIVSGVLIDVPLKFLSVAGDLALGGPIQGVLGSRNEMGLVALIALVTFGTELLTSSVTKRVGVTSVIGASLTIVFTQSPVSWGALALLGIISFALLFLRRMSPQSRRVWQTALAAVAAVTIIVAYSFRSQVVALINATDELNYRLALWRDLVGAIRTHPLEGWGWVGSWRVEIPPFFAFDAEAGILHYSALNAFIDVWFQVGLVGFVSFVILVTLALGRAWILAAHNKSRIFVWPALVLATLLVTSLAESTILVQYGWLCLVICAVKCAQHLSWRSGLGD